MFEQVEQIWASLINFRQIWSTLDKSDQFLDKSDQFWTNMKVFDQVWTSMNLFHLLEGLVAVNRVDVIVVVLEFPVPGALWLFMVAGVARGVADSFLALDVVGFIKLELVVVLRAFWGLAGVRFMVAEEVILMGLERAVMLGVDVVGFMTLLE